MDELEAVGDPDARAAFLFVRRSARPVTADDLAARATRGVEVQDVGCETHDCLADHASCHLLLRLRRAS